MAKKFIIIYSRLKWVRTMSINRFVSGLAVAGLFLCVLPAQAAIVSISLSGASASSSVGPLGNSDILMVTGSSGAGVTFDHRIEFTMVNDGGAAAAGVGVTVLHQANALMQITNLAYKIIDTDGITVLASGSTPSSIFAGSLDAL